MPFGIVVILAAALGALLTYIGARDFWHFVRLLWRGKRAKGQIVRDDRVTGLRTPVLYSVVAFRDEAGQRYEVRSRFQGGTSFKDQAREVLVAYDPKRPGTHAEAIIGRIAVLMSVRVLGIFPAPLRLSASSSSWVVKHACWRREATLHVEVCYGLSLRQAYRSAGIASLSSLAPSK